MDTKRITVITPKFSWGRILMDSVEFTSVVCNWRGRDCVPVPIIPSYRYPPPWPVAPGLIPCQVGSRGQWPGRGSRAGPQGEHCGPLNACNVRNHSDQGKQNSISIIQKSGWFTYISAIRIDISYVFYKRFYFDIFSIYHNITQTLIGLILIHQSPEQIY